MERVIFLIEDTNERISCMLNPEEGKGRGEDSDDDGGGGGVLVRRVSGWSPDKRTLSEGSDNAIIPDGQGQTSLELNLLFDVTLPGSTSMPEDVRKLTRPLWRLTEKLKVPDGQPHVCTARFIWGKAWDVPVAVESLSERYERFTPEGIPQRSWMKIKLWRVGEEIRPPSRTQFHLESLPSLENLAAEDGLSWRVHEVTGGESLTELANKYYEDPRLWRLIALANDIADPLHLKPGTRLQIPPVSLLRKKK